MKNCVLFLVLVLSITLTAQSNEHMVSTTGYLYNTSTMTWSLSGKTIINYYENGLRSEDFTYYWDGTGLAFTEYSSARQEYSYNQNGWETERINSLWVDNKWSPTWHYDRVYDEDGNLMSYLEMSWSGTDWINWAMTDYVRSSTGHIAINTTWSNDAWQNSSKSEYAYNDEGLNETRTMYLWRNDNWEVSGRITYTYDANNNLTGEIHESYSDGVYKPYSKQYKEYDINNNLTLWGFQNWNTTYSRWDDVNRNSYTYNENNQYTSHLLETWGGYFWTPYSKTEYEYSTATDIENNEVIISEFKLHNNYPNPFNPTTVVSFSIPQNSHVLLTVHSAIGERVATLAEGQKSAGEYQFTFDAVGLASGIYFYKLETDGFVEVKKMMFLK